MTDKEMLWLLYGALKVVSVEDEFAMELLKLLEQHLYPPIFISLESGVKS